MTSPLPLIRSRGVISAAAGFPAVRPTRNSNPSVSLPRTGWGPTWQTPGAPNWSDWFEITAGEASAYVLATLNLVTSTTKSTDWWVQLGVGAEQAESVIATFGNQDMAALPAGTSVFHNAQFRLDGYLLPASTRLVIRSRKTSATNWTTSFAAVVVATPSPPLFSADWDEETYRGGGVSSIERIPAVPDFATVVSGAGADTWGTPVAMIASAAGHLLIARLFNRNQGTTTGDGRFQIGIGAAGAEAWHELTAAPGAILGYFLPLGDWELPRPVEVLKGERVAVRYNTVSGGETAYIALTIHNLNF